MTPIKETDDILVASIQRFDEAWWRSELMRRRPEGETIYTVTEYPEALKHLENTIVAGGHQLICSRRNK